MEKKLLGHCFAKNGFIELKKYGINKDIFSTLRHKEYFELIQQIANDNDSIEQIYLIAEIEKNRDLETGEIDYIYSFTDVLGRENLKYYISFLKEIHKLKKLQSLGNCLIKKGDYAGLKDSLKEIETTLDDILEQEDSVSSLYKMSMDTINREKNISGVSVGIKFLEDAIKTFYNAELIFLAARPSIGKTQLSLQMALEQAKAGHSVLYFSLETTKEKLTNRVLAYDTGIPLVKLRVKDLNKEELDLISECISKYRKLHIDFDDGYDKNIFDIRLAAKYMQKLRKLDIIYIDYLQLIKSMKNYNSRYEAMCEITRVLKMLVKELNIPVVVLSQLSRDIEKRGDKKPKFSDLRDSGSIEQDADVILFLYEGDFENEINFYVAKNKDAIAGQEKTIYFDKSKLRFTEEKINNVDWIHN
jgi:replicative DNA helicase